MITFLKLLDENSIPYVSWKNNHEIELSLNGKTDLDIIVPEELFRNFLEIAHCYQWLQVENPVARYPYILHLYKHQSDGTLHHLHVYFRVVTGESWLKEYLLPLDKWLLANRVRSVPNKIWVLSDTVQTYLFALRHLLKGGSVFSRVLYRSELESYGAEWLRSNPLGLWPTINAPIDIQPYLSGAGLTSGSIRLPKWRTALRFRQSISPFLRYSSLTLPIRRFLSIVFRFNNKVFLKRKKIFPENGVVIAISGVDGSGKSTMIQEINKALSSFLTIRTFTLGKPQGWLIEYARKFIFSHKGTRIDQNSSNSIKTTEQTADVGLSNFKAFSAVILALLRLKEAHCATRVARKGYIALADRWPTRQVGVMDGPKIGVRPDASFLVSLCGNIEGWAYSKIPHADICLYLTVDIGSALERNVARVKAGKETDEEIQYRYESNKFHAPLCDRLIRFNNNGPLDEKKKELLQVLWGEIVRFQEEQIR